MKTTLSCTIALAMALLAHPTLAQGVLPHEVPGGAVASERSTRAAS